jgi:hypothetical protein
MNVGDVMLLEVVATLGGGDPTLRGAATSTLGGGVLVGGELEGPAMMAVSWRMASKCFSLSLAVAASQEAKLELIRKKIATVLLICY